MGLNPQVVDAGEQPIGLFPCSPWPGPTPRRSTVLTPLEERADESRSVRLARGGVIHPSPALACGVTPSAVLHLMDKCPTTLSRLLPASSTH